MNLLKKITVIAVFYFSLSAFAGTPNASPGFAPIHFNQWVYQAIDDKKLIVKDDGNIQYLDEVEKENACLEEVSDFSDLTKEMAFNACMCGGENNVLSTILTIGLDEQPDLRSYCLADVIKPNPSEIGETCKNSDGSIDWTCHCDGKPSVTNDGQLFCAGGSQRPEPLPSNHYQPAEIGQASYINYYATHAAPQMLTASSNSDTKGAYPEQDMDVGVYDMSGFEQVNTATGQLKLIHHDIHYPGNGGMDIDLYRVTYPLNNSNRLFTIPHGGYQISAGHMPFSGGLCDTRIITRYNNEEPLGKVIAGAYTYFDKQFNKHVFHYDLNRDNFYRDPTQNGEDRAYAFYSDTGWKGVCRLSIGTKRIDNRPVNYVDSIDWTLYRPDGRKITLAKHFNPNEEKPNYAGGIKYFVPALVTVKEEDTSGNALTYTWRGAYFDPNSYGGYQWLGLQSVTSSDNRTLTFDWEGFSPAAQDSKGEYIPPLINLSKKLTIKDDSHRQWVYEHDKSTMPDRRVWKLSISSNDARLTNPFGGVHKYEFTRSDYPDYAPKPIIPSHQKNAVLKSRTITNPNDSKDSSTWTYLFEKEGSGKNEQIKATVTDPLLNKTEYIHWNKFTAKTDTVHSIPDVPETYTSNVGCFRAGKLQSISHFKNGNDEPIRSIDYEYGINSVFYQQNCVTSLAFFSFPRRTTTTDEDGKQYVTEYTYGRDINNSAWRSLQPDSITIKNPTTSKVTRYTYELVDESTCDKVTKAPSQFITDEYWDARKTCGSNVAGKYFVAIKSTKMDGVALGTSTEYNSTTFLPESQTTYGITTSQTWLGGNLASSTDASGNTTKYSNYERGIPKTEELPNGTKITRTVNPIGVVKSVSVAGKDEKDEEGNQKTLTTTYDHTPIGLLKKVDYPKAGTSSTKIDYVWWKESNPTQAHKILTRGNYKQTTYYDHLGRVVKTEDEDTSDINKTITQKTQYDALGRLKKSLYPNDTNGISYTYDALGRIKTTCDDANHCTTTDYNGDAVTVTDANRHSTKYLYQRFGSDLQAELIAIVSPEKVGTNIIRDKKGDIKSVEQGTVSQYDGTSRPTLEGSVTRSLTYFPNKGLGIETVNDPERGVLTYGRDSAGRITSETVGGTSKTFTYDNMNRVEKVVFAKVDNKDNPLNKTFGYDGFGRLFKAGNGVFDWRYTHDDNGNLQKATMLAGNGTIKHSVSYDYDNLDHLKTLTYPSGRQLTYKVNPLAQIESLKQGSKTLVSNATYYPTGTVKSMTLGNGGAYSTALNARKLVENIDVDGGDVSVGYTYDSVGNVATIAQTGQAKKTLHYDGMNRLDSVNYSDNSLVAFDYDVHSNLTRKTITNVYHVGNVDWTYAYDANSKRLKSITGSDYDTFAYDRAGNVTHDGKHSFGYNANHQLEKIDGDTVSYLYDANDERVAEIKNGKTTVSFYNGGKLLGEYDYDGAKLTAVREYAHFGNQTIAQFEIGASNGKGILLKDSFELNSPVAPIGGGSVTDKITYLYKDALGSTIAKADDKGNLVWQENRLPYGKNVLLSKAQINADPLQYTDAPLDSYSGLTYLKARYYNADIGRFYATDPVWFTADNVQMFNRYAYANNNPYKYVDPDGELPWLLVPVVISMYFGTADTAQAPTYEGDIKYPSLGDRAIIAGATGAVGAAATAAVISMGPKEVAQTAFEETTGVEIPIPSVKKGVKQTYEIIDGVRRAKAAQLLGKETIKGDVFRNGKKIQSNIELKIKDLKSPHKNNISLKSESDFKRFNKAKNDVEKGVNPNISVEKGSRGKDIDKIWFNTGDEF